MGARGSKQLPPELNDLEGFDTKEVDGYKGAFKEGGLSKLQKKIGEDIDKWKKVPVNIAVTGNSGVGKSSFINTFRGLKAKAKGAAAVDVTETTEKLKKYLHPSNDNIALWDLPGMGTKKFPKETYLRDVEFKNYDYFIIVTATRFTENDIWLAHEVQRLGKKFFFIRTKIDADVQNEKKDNPDALDIETIDKVRKSTTQHVKAEGFKEDVEVYLINNHSEKEYDFQILIEDMIKKAPILKQEAMTLSLTTLTEDLICRKRDALRKRIMFVAIGSAAGGAVPVPGLSFYVDTGILISECMFYREQFGLDDISLTENAKKLEMSVESLQQTIKMQSYLLGTTVKSTISFLGTLAVAEVAEKVTAIALPIIGNIIAATISYGSTVAMLRSLLNAFVTDALAINKLLMEQLSKKSIS